MIVGIDLGTTNSLCAVLQDGELKLIPNAHGQVLTPSMVGILASGEVVVGEAARELKVTQPERVVGRFKRWMGMDRQVPLGKKTWSPVELSSMVLRALKADAEAFLKQPVTEAVVTVPAYFNEHQRRSTVQAGELAGLKVRRIINEPTAAALAYGFNERDKNQTILVMDLGGGTFDVTVMQVFEGVFEIISTAGEGSLGGEDFTDRLASEILSRQGLSLERAEMTAPLLVSRLLHECERAKRDFSQQDVVEIRVPQQDGSFADDSPSIQITREEFAKLSKSLMDRVRGPVGKAIRDANLSPEKINEVLLVGGATRMSLISSFVKDELKKEPMCRLNPDEVVALGAAVQGALLEDVQEVQDLVLTDVCPFSLGINIVKDIGMDQYQSGYFLPIIHRNTTIPTSCEHVVSTVNDFQTEISIEVYQGEARKVQDNLLLGKFSLKGIPRGPKGKMVRVRFTYDMNGLLEVEAIVEETGNRESMILTKHAGHLSPSEIKAARQKMQDLKFYPRDELENQQLLRMCERLVGELPPSERARFERVVDQFEAAMGMGDRELFESSKAALKSVLEEYGLGGDLGGEHE
jgi:molecular chaperone HscC